MSCNSHNDPDRFRIEIDAIKSTLQTPLILIHPHKNESWDVGLGIFDPDTGNTIYFFFDAISSPASDRFVNPIPDYNAQYYGKRDNYVLPEIIHFPDEGCQYQHTRDVMQHRLFSYFYLNTNNIDSSFSVGNLVQLSRKHTLGLAGPILRDLYSCGWKEY